MMFLSGIDPEHVVEVQEGKRTGRGCGKTLAKMVQQLSYLRYSNIGKRYLFICENDEMAQDINYYFYFWIADIGYYARSNDEDSSKHDNDCMDTREYHVSVHAPIPRTFWDSLKNIFTPTRSSGIIFVKFVPASWKLERGTKSFDKIIIDVSEEAGEKYKKEISRVIKYGHKNR